MDGTVLGQALANIVLATDAGDGRPISDVMPAAQQTKVVEQWTNIATAIVSHIQTYGAVSVTIPSLAISTPPPGYTNATPVAGTGTIS